MKRPRLVSLLICAYCAVNAADLVWPWMRSGGWSLDSLAFTLWTSPLFAFWSLRNASPVAFGESPLSLGVSILLSFFGSAASLAVFRHLGFALSLSALLPARPLLGAWLVASFSWIPGFEGLWAGVFPGCATGVKLAAASLTSLYLTFRIVFRGRGAR
jgi:hypothetical protein